jgi:hypothetical protein
VGHEETETHKQYTLSGMSGDSTFGETSPHPHPLSPPSPLHNHPKSMLDHPSIQVGMNDSHMSALVSGRKEKAKDII